MLEDDDDVAPGIDKLSKDLKAASKVMSRNEARYLVSAYYSVQDERKRYVNQERAMVEAGEPHEMVSYLAKMSTRLETQIKLSLDVYTHNDPVGIWLRANKGIGPVIAAGLLAHIDINKAPTVGHIWRYGGYDPTMKWHGKGIADVIRAARVAEGDGWAALLWVSRAVNVRVSNILVNAKLLEPEAVVSPEEAAAYAIQVLKTPVKPKAEFHSDNVLKELLPEDALPDAYKALYKGVKIKWDAITKALAKRPWNSELKTLLWKISESFKKVSGGEKPSPYGQIYRDYKGRIQAKNQAGDYAEAAKDILASKRISKTTDAWFWYSGEWVNHPRLNPEVAAAVELKKQQLGDSHTMDEYLKMVVEEGDRRKRPMLPPAHIDARAGRYAVKIFLSHMHEIMYKRVLKKNPPKPYPIEHLGHIHYIEPFIRDDDLDLALEVAAE
jgi:hypothetical protein